MVDTTGPSAPSLSLSSATGNTYLNGTTAYINAQAGKSGSFQATATSTDNDSGICSRSTSPAPQASPAAAATATAPPYQTTYNWSGAVGSLRLHKQPPPTTTPTSPTPTPSPSHPTQPTPPAAPHRQRHQRNRRRLHQLQLERQLDDRHDQRLHRLRLRTHSSILTRQSATLSSSNGIAAGSCGSFGSATTIGSRSTPIAQALAGPTCYLYTLTGLDNVGNTVTITTTVMVDTTGPSAPSLSLSSATGNTYHQRHDRLHQRPGRQVGQLPGRSHQHRQRLRPAQGQLPQPHRLLQRRRRQQQLPLPDHLQLVGRRRSLRLTNNHRLQQRQPHQHQHLHHHTRHNRPHRRRSHRQRHQRNRRRLHQHHEQPGLHDRDADELHGRIRVRACVEHADGSVRDAHEQQQLCGAAGSGGPYTSPTTIAGTTNPAITVGYCYLYTLTGRDNVGNAASVSTLVKVPFAGIDWTASQQRPHLHVHGHHRCHVHRGADREPAERGPRR